MDADAETMFDAEVPADEIMKREATRYSQDIVEI